MLVVAVVYPVFNQHPGCSLRLSCLNNLKQIGLAINMYSEDWQGKYPTMSTFDQCVPDGKAWPDCLSAYVKNPKIFICPASNHTDRLTYSFNRRASGIACKDEVDPAVAVVVYDSVSDSKQNNNLNGDSVWKPSDGGYPKNGQFAVFSVNWSPSHWPDWTYPNHVDSVNALYADYHVKNVSYDSCMQVPPTFDPKASK